MDIFYRAHSGRWYAQLSELRNHSERYHESEACFDVLMHLSLSTNHMISLVKVQQLQRRKGGGSAAWRCWTSRQVPGESSGG